MFTNASVVITDYDNNTVETYGEELEDTVKVEEVIEFKPRPNYSSELVANRAEYVTAFAVSPAPLVSAYKIGA